MAENSSHSSSQQKESSSKNMGEKSAGATLSAENHANNINNNNSNDKTNNNNNNINLNNTNNINSVKGSEKQKDSQQQQHQASSLSHNQQSHEKPEKGSEKNSEKQEKQRQADTTSEGGAGAAASVTSVSQMTVTSDDVNYLIYRYLQESGFVHSAFSFAHESMLGRTGLRSSDKSVPPGALITFLQKGLQYVGIEETLAKSNKQSQKGAAAAAAVASANADPTAAEHATTFAAVAEFTLISPAAMTAITRSNPPIQLNVPPATAAAAIRARLNAEAVKARDKLLTEGPPPLPIPILNHVTTTTRPSATSPSAGAPPLSASSDTVPAAAPVPAPATATSTSNHQPKQSSNIEPSTKDVAANAAATAAAAAGVENAMITNSKSASSVASTASNNNNEVPTSNSKDNMVPEDPNASLARQALAAQAAAAQVKAASVMSQLQQKVTALGQGPLSQASLQQQPLQQQQQKPNSLPALAEPNLQQQQQQQRVVAGADIMAMQQQHPQGAAAAIALAAAAASGKRDAPIPPTPALSNAGHPQSSTQSSSQSQQQQQPQQLAGGKRSAAAMQQQAPGPGPNNISNKQQRLSSQKQQRQRKSKNASDDALSLTSVGSETSEPQKLRQQQQQIAPHLPTIQEEPSRQLPQQFHQQQQQQQLGKPTWMNDMNRQKSPDMNRPDGTPEQQQQMLLQQLQQQQQMMARKGEMDPAAAIALQQQIHNLKNGELGHLNVPGGVLNAPRRGPEQQPINGADRGGPMSDLQRRGMMPSEPPPPLAPPAPQPSTDPAQSSSDQQAGGPAAEGPDPDDIETEAAKSEVLQLQMHESEVFMCAWNPVYTNLIATGSGDASARIWEMLGGSAKAGLGAVKLLPHGTDPRDKKNKDVTTLEWSSDGEYLATGSYDGVARVWGRNGALLITLRKHTGPIFSLKWNKKGNFILSGSYDTTTIVWDITGRSPDHVVQQFTEHKAPALDVDWRDNNTFASCSTDKSVHIYRIGDEKPLRVYQGHTDEVNAVKWDPSKTFLASCSDDCTAKVWAFESDSTAPLYTFDSHSQEIYTVKWSPSGPGTANPNKQSLLATASFDGTVRLWSILDGSCFRIFKRHKESVYSVAFSPSGDYLASGSLAGQMYIWNIQEGRHVKSYKGTGDIFEVAWNREGARVAACFSSNVVAVIDFDRQQYQKHNQQQQQQHQMQMQQQQQRGRPQRPLIQR